MPPRRRAVTGKQAWSDPRPDPRPDPARKPDHQPRQAGRGVTLGWPGFTPPSWPVFPPPLTPGRGDRLSGRAAHLGTEPDAPSASALPGAGWWNCAGRPELDCGPTRLLPARPGTVAAVPQTRVRGA